MPRLTRLIAAGICLVASHVAVAAPPIEAVAFLEGTWRGRVEGSLVEEIWSAPQGSSVMGVFRWCRPDGTPAMFEILAITREGEGDGAAVRLRLRHYSPTLVAKEAADRPLTLVLRESTASSALFVAEADRGGDLESIRYAVERDDAGERLAIEIRFVARGEPAAQRPPLTLTLERRR
jgi:hypothetical protein